MAEKVTDEPISLSEAVKLVKTFGTTKFDPVSYTHLTLPTNREL